MNTQKQLIALFFLVALMVSGDLHAQDLECNPNPSNRAQVTESNAPSSYTCYMVMRRGWFSKKLGTGMLIHPRVVLTAGHNTAFYMFSKSFPFVISSVRNVNMYFGSKSKEDYIIKESVRLKKGKTKFFNNGYWIAGSVDRDFSIIILPDNSVYDAVGGHYVLKPITSESDIKGNINLTGSPGDKPVFETWTEDTENFKIDGAKLSYDLFTAVRNSGSPVWFVNENNEYQVAGVHSRKDFGCNASVLINQDTYDKIVEWCKMAGIEL